MPTYHARGVSIRLGVTPLTGTITPNIILKKGDDARKQMEEAEQQLLNSRFLNEKRVTFPGDEHSYELNWLGGAPFLQSEAGRDLFSRDGKTQSKHSNSAKDRARLPHSRAKDTPYAVTPDPLALSLHVITSHRTFVSGLNDSNKLHIKIEVFLNGRLSNCLFFPPYEYRSGAKDLHQVFGGHRVDFLAERPWVILPPGMAADGTQKKTVSASSVEQRWQEIGEALSIEADHRGTNEDSVIPPTAEFLKALATMDMPDQVRDMQSRGTKKLAIIDVVITAGNGRKVTVGAAYLKAPQRFDDENFPLRGAAESSEDVEMILQADRSQAEARDDIVSAIQDDAGAEEEVATDLDRPPKRRAIDLHGLPRHPNRPDQQRTQPRDTSHTGQFPSSRSPTKGALGETQRPTMLNLAPSTIARSGPFYVASPQYGRTNQAEYDHHVTGSVYGGSLYGTPQSFPSLPSSSISHAHTPRTQFSPYSVHFTGSASSQHSSGTFSPYDASQVSDLALSPFNHMQSVASSPLATMFPQSQSLVSDRFSEHGLPAPAFQPSAFQQPPRRSSMGSSSMTHSSPATPQVWPGDELFSQLTPQNPSFVPNMLPSIASHSHIAGPRSGGMPMSSPFDRRFSMPLPPTGFFSVPTKPKPSMSPRKEGRPAKEKTSSRAISVRRLVIKGKEGVKIVDHSWPVIQHVPLRGQAISSTTSRSLTESKGSVAATRAGNSGRAGESVPRESTPRIEDAPQTRPSVNPSPNIAEVCEDAASAMPGGPVDPHKNEGTMATEPLDVHDSPQPAHSNSAPPETKPEKPRTSSRAPPQRRTASYQGILGIQGPKATAFIFEDPEQLVREAAKEKRKKAPRKPKSSAVIGSDATVALPATPSITLSPGPPAILSSPLSSIHTTPDLDGAADGHTAIAAPHTPTATGEVPLHQLDGPSDRANPTTSPIKPKSFTSPIKIIPNSKKRKLSTSTPTMTRYLEKQPRSPDRLKTIGNPPLNQDCVVALAESKDKSVKRGVLRQVRGERQGVFAEEYVVCATRFYVPGN